MERKEKIFLILTLIAFGVVAFANRRTIAAPAQAAPAVEGTATAIGPAYTTYNAPWNFAPPVGNFLPPITVGQIGQQVTNPAAIQTANDASCGSC